MSEVVCPGLFYATPARDGVLSRVRIPGGILTAQQCVAIATLADQFGGGYVQITNRANVQIREIQTGIAADALIQLQKLGLASPVVEVDPIRNIMSSPTAGIDCHELLDTRPLVMGWDQYISTHPHLGILSAKFSVCLDGGGSVSVRDRPNDIGLVAVEAHKNVYFRLQLSAGELGDAPCDVGVLVRPEDSLIVLAALAEVYHDWILQLSDRTATHRRTRFRQLLNDWGVEAYLQTVENRLPFSWQRCDVSTATPMTLYRHIGVHAQRQPGCSYIGVVLPLGRLDTQQLQGLAALAAQHGSSTLRLTPWQNVLIPDIPHQQLSQVQQTLEVLGLHWSATHPGSAIVACSGKTGCVSSATDTKRHALILTAHLEQHITLDRPINIHFSGCEKSCAQHHPSDIALLGVATDGAEAYRIYVGSDGSTFGREYQDCSFRQLPELIEHMLRTYQNQRISPNETFREFANRHATDVKEVFNQ